MSGYEALSRSFIEHKFIYYIFAAHAKNTLHTYSLYAQRKRGIIAHVRDIEMNE